MKNKFMTGLMGVLAVLSVEGRVISVMPVSVKAFLPSCSIPSWRSILVRDEHFWNALLPIFVIVSGRYTSLSVSQL